MQEFMDQNGDPLTQVSKMESSLWSGKHSEVNELYPHILSAYERLILDHNNQEEARNAEYSLWKFHYKQIDEFRRRSSNNNTVSVEAFSSFLDLAVNAYTSLIETIKKNYGISNAVSWFEAVNHLPATDKVEVQNLQFLCYRFLVCLGDLTRYKEQFCIKREKLKNWGSAAAYYVEATRVLPHDGHAQNQLAVLATYEGDSFSALYRCVRSLACSQPFADARNNLLLLFEENRSTNFYPFYEISCFDFSKPGERLQPRVEGDNLWDLIMRSLSFFFTPSSLDDFNLVFAAMMMELDAVLLLDNSKLEAKFQANYSLRKGPFRVLQVFSVFMFALETQMGSDNQEMIRVALASVFVFFGRIAYRCGSNSALETCPLLPAVLAFVERLQLVLNTAKPYACDENVARAITYFIGGFSSLVRSVDACRAVDSRGVCLWEDLEMRGFACFAPPHEPSVFSCEQVCQNESNIRLHRLLNVSVPDSNLKKQWFLSDVKLANLDEEEVVLFKSLGRNKSVPACSKDEKILQRAMSLLITQNPDHYVNINPPGPPPLTPFVGRIKGPQLAPVDEVPVEVVKKGSFVKYEAPLPSAPVLPEDATWHSSNSSTWSDCDNPEFSGPLTSSEWLRRYRETCKWKCYDIMNWRT